MSKPTPQKLDRERVKRARRIRKLARRHKPRSHHMPNPNLPGEELPKYANLLGRLEADLSELAELHRGRDEASIQLQALGLTRGRLNQSVLDAEAPQATLLENLRELEGEKLLLEASLSALEPRVARHETELHSKFPDMLRTFETLRAFTSHAVLESCRQAVRGLIDPGTSVDQSHIDALALCMPPYVQVSRITLPSLTHTISRPLTYDQPHWSSLVRPFTEAEKRAQRAETVKALVEASNAAILAFRGLLEAAGPYAEGVPVFKCEPEPVIVATVDPKFLEWQTPLGGSDEEWLRQICEQAGKPYPPTDPAQIEILNRMLEARHAHPIAHGIVTGEMVGATYQEEPKR